MGLFLSHWVTVSNFSMRVFLHLIMHYVVMFGCYLYKACYFFLMKDIKGIEGREHEKELGVMKGGKLLSGYTV